METTRRGDTRYEMCAVFSLGYNYATPYCLRGARHFLLDPTDVYREQLLGNTFDVSRYYFFSPFSPFEFFADVRSFIFFSFFSIIQGDSRN